MGAFVCDGCKRNFESEEARCPKCLRKSTVRELEAWPTERPSSHASEPRSRAGLQLALIALSVVISILAGTGAFSMEAALEQLSWQYPVWIGISLASIVSVRIAPRFAIEADVPLLAYLGWLGIAALVFVSVVLSGALAIWMVSTDSIVVTFVLAVLLWLGMAIPAFNYGLRRAALRETTSAPRSTGKWR